MACGEMPRSDPYMSKFSPHVGEMANFNNISRYPTEGQECFAQVP